MSTTARRETLHDLEVRLAHSPTPGPFAECELDGLPDPVRRYMPRPDPLPRPPDGARVRRHDVLGGFIHEHDLAAWFEGCVPSRLQHQHRRLRSGALVVLLLTVGCGATLMIVTAIRRSRAREQA